jgi:pyruvate formate lyase activating enzyme
MLETVRKEAMLYEKREKGGVHCYLCSHHCRIAESNKGFCNVRENIGGTLYTNSYGKIISQTVDPIEKKPLFHFLPGSKSFSVAAIGCNFRCGFCQNWQISQVDEAREMGFKAADAKPEEIVNKANRSGCQSISYTYTEPTIFFEFAYETAKLAQQEGLKNIFVTNGYMTKEALDTISPFLDAANVDLKSFSNDFYKRNCKAKLQPVLDSISYMNELGIWLEVTTLIIPGQNDSEEELDRLAGFIAGVDKDIPWHISMFYPAYEFTELPPTSIESLRRAKQTGEKRGLRYVYLGNVAADCDTYCPDCGQLLVSRSRREVGLSGQFDKGRCTFCDMDICGFWA